MKFALKGKGNKKGDGDKTSGGAGAKGISGIGNSRRIGGAKLGGGIGLKLGGGKLGGGKLGGGELGSGLRGNNKFNGTKSNAMFGSGSESESDDEESRFKKMVAAKAAKVTKEVIDLGEQTVEIDDKVEKTDHINSTSQPTERKSKYLDQLLETNRKRKQEQLAAQMNIDTGESYVFESEEYKAKKQKVEEEEDELETNTGTFYAKVLEAKMGRGEPTETKSDESIGMPKDGNDSENIHEIMNIPNDKENSGRTSATVNLPGKDRPKEIKHKSSSNQTILSTNALSILRGLIATKITKEDIARYREEYFTRRKMVSHPENQVI